MSSIISDQGFVADLKKLVDEAVVKPTFCDFCGPLVQDISFKGAYL